MSVANYDRDILDFDRFKAELTSIKEEVVGEKRKTVRDEGVRDRVRGLYRTWRSVVEPRIAPLLREKREFLKLGRELEVLAQLTTRNKHVTEYRKRINNAIRLASGIILYLPVVPGAEVVPRVTSRDKLFISGISDLPMSLVPNPLLGWKSRIEGFVGEHPFDQSVFVMVRYRKTNETLIKSVKDVLKKNGCYGVLASDHHLTDDLYNPVACLLCCSRGIVIFDKGKKEQTINPNVAYELGMMHLMGRDCLILKHESLKVLQADILMKLYSEYSGVDDARKHVEKWVGGDDMNRDGIQGNMRQGGHQDGD